MIRGLTPIAKAYNALLYGMAYVAAFLTAAMMVTITVDVLLRNLGFLELLGRKLIPIFGGCYVIVARKRLQRLIPIRTQWRARRRLIAAGVVEPTTFQAPRDED